MQRRTVLKGAVGLAGLAMPTIGRAEKASTLTFIPQSDVTVLDPIWTTAQVTANHGYVVFDTLYGLDDSYTPQPQMVAGHTVEQDGKLWRLTLRDGLRFHDGQPVLARDAVASIRRWAARDGFGLTLMEVTDALSAVSDKVLEFRLKRPFPLLPAALGKSATNMPCIMPERLALTDPFKQVTEMVGSGPYRYVANERVVGAQAIYERFDGYVPRPDGRASYTAGPKVAHFERIKWLVIPDSATAQGAMQSGEADWLEQPIADLLPLLRKNSKLTIATDPATSAIAALRFNFLHPPFDNPALRRAVLSAITQADFMTAVTGDERGLWQDRCGVFNAVSPLATDAGLEVMSGDIAKAKLAVQASGYRGEKVVVLAPADSPAIYALSQVGADLFRRIGINVDLQSVDWGTLNQRRASRKQPDQGGWNVFFTFLSGPNQFDPAAHLGLRANGDKAWFGWPTDPKLEQLRQDWFAAKDMAGQKQACADIQLQAWESVPFIPLGLTFWPTCYSKNLVNRRTGAPQFYDIKRA